jgi:hypothetical protein
MKQLLDQMEAWIQAHPERARFDPQYHPEEIELMEKAFDIRLPESYKAFLELFDGGFIFGPSLMSVAERGDMETVRWNSFVLFGIRELMSHYEDLVDRDWKVYDFEGPFPYIPFASTPVNELLVFVNRPWGASESPVFDAFHEEPADAWGVVAPTFGDFLLQYLDSGGNPSSIGSESDLKATEMRWEPDPGTWEGLQKPKAVIRRTTAYLKLYPYDRYALKERAAAYEKSGRFEEAQKDLEDSEKVWDRYADPYE